MTHKLLAVGVGAGYGEGSVQCLVMGLLKKVSKLRILGPFLDLGGKEQEECGEASTPFEPPTTTTSTNYFLYQNPTIWEKEQKVSWFRNFGHFS